MIALLTLATVELGGALVERLETLLSSGVSSPLHRETRAHRLDLGLDRRQALLEISQYSLHQPLQLGDRRGSTPRRAARSAMTLP